MTHPAATTCVICTGERAAHVGYLCRGHLERLGAMLREVEDQAAMLSAVPSMQQRTGSGRGSLASERSPARLDALVLLDPQTRQWTRDTTSRHPLPAPKAHGPWCLLCNHDTCTDWRAGRQRDMHDDEHDAGSDRLMSILGVLNGWARVVREERDLTSPERVTVTSERDTLSRHLNWLVEQPFIDEMYAEIRQLAASLKALNHTQDERPAGTCFLPAAFGVCDGRIWRRDQHRILWRVKSDRCEREAVKVADGWAYCDRCGATWDGRDLHRLALILEQQRAELARPKTEDGRRMLTAQELVARGYVSSVSNVRVRAHRLGVGSVNGHYDPDPFIDKASA